MKIIQWNKLLDDPVISLFHCEKCYGKIFQPIQTISLKYIDKEKSITTPIQYVECISCKTIYALVQEESNEFKIQAV